MEDADTVRGIIRRIAQEILDDGELVASQLSARVHSHAPGMADEAELHDATLRAGLAVVTQLAERLRDGVAMDEVPLPRSLVEYAEEFVHRGIEMPVLLGVVRLGYAEFAGGWSDRLRASDAPPRLLADALSTSMLEIFAYVDALSSGLAVIYSAERERWSRSVEAIRADVVRSLLEGDPVDARAAERQLSHRLDTTQLAFILWSDPRDHGSAGIEIEAAARRLVAATPATRGLLVPTGGHTLSAWIAGADATTVAAIAQAGLVAPVELGIRAALGAIGDGRAGFRASHEQAQHARRVATLVGTPANSLTSYPDIALAALATADFAHAEAFVAAELGALAAMDEATRRIAETVRVYLDEGRNRAGTARRMNLHANTVAYRLGQAVRLLGRDLDQRTAELHVALIIAALVRPSGRPLD